ncbi:hypothetical protein HDV00_005311 [Rhizophlyctis rosea]|nr:hypothetical protein HDV00_005311 [Rhizophlyctis rosea]
MCVVLFMARSQLPDISTSPFRAFSTPSPVSTPTLSPEPPKPRIAIITLDFYDISPQWMGPAITSKLNFCTRHNYTCMVFTKRLHDENIAKVWDKIYLAQQILPLYDWLWILDADSYLTNANITLESVIARSQSLHRGDEDMDVIISRDENALNCGSFFLRNSPWTRSMVDMWWAMRKEQFPLWDAWFEQAALIRMYDNDLFGFRQHTSVVPQHFINSYPPYKGDAMKELRAMGKYRNATTKDWWWRPGDLVMHGPGFYKFAFEDFVKDPFGL